MLQVLAALDGAWKVLAVGLILGAGLPALFSFGVRQLAASGVTGSADTKFPKQVHRVLAYVIFGLVILCVAAGLSYIVAHGFGYTVTFGPAGVTIVHK